MIHNDTAYHVAVRVRGNRFTASIEGQEIDSWTDDAPRSGGVGFFADAGERARLYWMKVAKNDDWLGRICAYVSGNAEEESQTTAWLERPQIPGPTPGRREWPHSEELIPAGEVGESLPGQPQRPRLAWNARSRTWSS
jgi:hypothetical protein